MKTRIAIAASMLALGAASPVVYAGPLDLGVSLDADVALDSQFGSYLNTATTAELRSGLGLSAAEADAVTRYRKQKGPITSAADVRAIEGLSAKSRERLTAGLEGSANAGADAMATGRGAAEAAGRSTMDAGASAASRTRSGLQSTGSGLLNSGSNAAGSLSGSAAGSAQTMVDLNAASEAELTAVPGVSAADASKIVRYRTRSGNFTSIRQVSDVPGISAETRQALSAHAMVHGEAEAGN